MSSDDGTPYVIRVAPEGTEADVRSWLLGTDADGAKQTGPDRLLEALEGNRRIGALWVIISPGRIATLIGPRTDNAPDDIGARLIDEANGFIDRRQVTLAQVLLDLHQESLAQLFHAAGYEHVVELDYLVSTSRPSDPHKRTPEGISYEPYQATMQERLQHLLGRTYEASQDCPALNGVRQLDDVLDGYRYAGAGRDQNWYLIKFDGEDVGCLLLADHPADDRWEMIYLGVVPERRGQGIAIAATYYAQRQAKRAGRARLTLAVDATNRPAQFLYHKAGFIQWDRRRVLLRFC